MMRAIIPLLFVMLCPVVLAQDINVPAKIDAKVGQDSIIYLNKITAKDVQYKVYGDGKFTLTREVVDDPGVILFRFRPLTQSKFTLVVAGALGDKLVVKECAINAVPEPVDPPPIPQDQLKEIREELAKIGAAVEKIDGIAKDLKSLEARVKALEDKKPVPPAPVPDKIAKHVTFIGPELNATSLAINNDVELRGMLKSAGVSVHVLRANDPDIADKGFAKYVVQAGGAPCLVIQEDNGKVIDQGPMTSRSQVESLIFRYVKR